MDLMIDLAYWKQYKPFDEDDEIRKHNRIRRLERRLARVSKYTRTSFQT